MVGSVVGVGVFGLPFVFSQTGYGAGLLVLLLLSSTMTGILFMYADVIAHTPGEHRFAGIIETYLGKRFGRRQIPQKQKMAQGRNTDDINLSD